MPKIGDFFRTAPQMRPVNPKPVSLTAVCKDLDTLPSGVANNAKKQVAAKVDACFVFLGSLGMEEARREARKYIAEKEFDPKAKFAMAIDDYAVEAELQKQILWRVLREYDKDSQLAGDPQFPTVKLLREMLETTECNRLMTAYNAYVKEEHPEAVDPETFRGSEG